MVKLKWDEKRVIFVVVGWLVGATCRMLKKKGLKGSHERQSINTDLICVRCSGVCSWDSEFFEAWTRWVLGFVFFLLPSLV